MTRADLRVFGDAMRQQAILGSKVAFVDPTRQVTFGEFNDRVNRLVDALVRRGLELGDRVALLGQNSIALAECVATAKAGFIPVPLNWRLAPAELLALLHDCAPAALVCDEHWVETAESTFPPAVSGSLKVAIGPQRDGWLDFEGLIESGSAIEPASEPSPDDTALLIYPSGTTGNPKAAMISHRGLIENCLASGSLAIGVDESDTILCVMPMFHVGGLCYYLLPSFIAGSTSILRPAFDLADLLHCLRTYPITNVHLVPTMISDLVGHPDAPEVEAGATLKRIVYAGSTMPVALLERAMTVFRSCSFSQSYGSTEGGIVSTLGPAEHVKAGTSVKHAHLMQSCGRPIGECDLRIVRDDGTECSVSEPGEVLVRSARTMSGYWNLPEKTAAAFDDGFLRTGDIGHRDAKGYLYLIDRKNDMVVTGGENVFPSEVEQVLYRSPDVAEAAVFGVPDPRWIEKVVAAVVLRPGSRATPEDVISFARQHLAAYKCPKTVFLVSDLPRSGVGKVSRKLLRTRFRGADMPPSG
jgi:acyl-CoA synthetase (AMP-forming)/AMP-acid ligase II